MAKRKRALDDTDLDGHKKLAIATDITIQIIAGSYDRVLHGVTATIRSDSSTTKDDEVLFADTFLFHAHSSAIRCLALSPPSSSTDASQDKRIILASGSTDERINLYSISTSPPQESKAASITTLADGTITENPKNRELGSLLHHSSSLTVLQFPSHSKLLSAGEDNTIAITRTRDWTVLSTIKCPIPKALGRPSGDTAPLGDTPAGINDFSIHPSMKLMISVGKGEKCMRSWNLITGKKAAVLSFERDLLRSVSESRWSSGEGRKVEWNSQGDAFVIGFERGAVVFGMVRVEHTRPLNRELTYEKDSKPKYRIVPSPPSKIHQMHYVSITDVDNNVADLLALSTEDGRVLFYPSTPSRMSETQCIDVDQETPICKAIGQIRGPASESIGRIKDFEVLKVNSSGSLISSYCIVTGSSNGTIRLWSIEAEDLQANVCDVQKNDDVDAHYIAETREKHDKAIQGEQSSPQIGRLIGVYETGNRITCLKAFVMVGVAEADESSEARDGANGNQRF